MIDVDFFIYQSLLVRHKCETFVPFPIKFSIKMSTATWFLFDQRL